MAVALDGMELDLVSDYSKTTEAVYIEIVRRILRHTGSFDILRCVETLKHDDTLPNWIPDCVEIYHLFSTYAAAPRSVILRWLCWLRANSYEGLSRQLKESELLRRG
jgi:hypothetical protein